MKVSNVLEQRIGGIKGEVFDAFKGEPVKQIPCGDRGCPDRKIVGLDELLGKASGAMIRVVAS
ncbi:MAG: hypothetical protein AB8B60_20970 [Sulfitobacter sp.]